jgi:hypothetical protein
VFITNASYNYDIPRCREKGGTGLKMSDKVRPDCRPLMKIDHYGEVLVGCIDCNRWGHPGDDKLVMELMDSDLEALRGTKGESG